MPAPAAPAHGVRGPALACAALATTWAFGCAAPPVALDDLPESPIAAVYWSYEEARRRNEVLEQMAGVRAHPTREGVASLEGLGALVGAGRDRSELSRKLSQWPGRVGLVDPRTGRVERLAAAPVGARPLAWSRDHRRLLFASASRSDSAQIFEWDRGTGDVRQLTRGRFAHPVADYDPDGGVVYLSVYLQAGRLESRVEWQRAGAPRAEVVVEDRFFTALRVAPDGRRIVVCEVDPRQLSSSREAIPTLLSIPLPGASGDEGGAERVLGHGKDPDFSGDGRWLVYAARTSAGWRIARARADGGGRIPIGRSPREESSPAASPDGEYVIHLAREGEFDRLFVRRSDGSGERLLSDDEAFASPVW